MLTSSYVQQYLNKIKNMKKYYLETNTIFDIFMHAHILTILCNILNNFSKE